MATPQLEDIQIDFLMLADHAEVLNGKLYVMGGAYDRKRVHDLTKPINVVLALGIVVPWHLANEEHPVNLVIEDQDGTSLLQSSASVNVGRPPNAVKGQVFRAMFCVAADILLPRLGTYRVVLSCRSAQKAVSFIAHNDSI